jgi:hypothetical protein
MKNWKLTYRVAFMNSVIVVFIGVISAVISGSDGFGLVLGIVCLLGGLLSFLLTLIAYGASSKEWAKGFLLSGGILLLLSGISCGAGLSGVNFH